MRDVLRGVSCWLKRLIKLPDLGELLTANLLQLTSSITWRDG